MEQLRIVEEYYLPKFQRDRRMLGSDSEAKSAVQEAFTKFFAAAGDYHQRQPCPNLGGLLMTINKHVVISMFRATDRVELVEIMEEGNRNEDEVLSLLSTDSGHGAAMRKEHALTPKAAAALAECIASLPEMERECLTLIYVHNYKFREVAEALDLRGIGEANQLESRALRAICNCLKKKGYPEIGRMSATLEEWM